MDNFFNKESLWIWIKDWEESDKFIPQFVYFRKEIMLNDKPEEANIKISADSRYHLFINGVSVVFGPCKGDDKVWFYEELDIAPYLKVGKNCIAATVLRYPTEHRKGNQSIWRTDKPGFYLSGSIVTGAMECIDLHSDKTWKTSKCTDIEILPEGQFLSYLWNLEHAQGNREVAGWKEADYDDSRWENAKPYSLMEMNGATSPGNLTKRTIPLMFEQETNFKEIFCIRQSSKTHSDWANLPTQKKRIHIPAHQHEMIEISAGEMTTGFLQLKVSGGERSIIKIVSAEAYVYPQGDSNTLDLSIKKGDRADWQNGSLIGYEDQYTVAGYGTEEKPEKYEPFWFRTFRFVKLEIQTEDEALIIEQFNYRETGYPLEVKTHVVTSDQSLDAIWDISLRSLKRCMHETYEDCPFFEQLQYAMDTRSQILYTYSVSADDRLARKAIDDFHRSLRHDGMINCCYPSYEPNIIPGFSLYYVLMIYDHMMYFGDKSLVKRYMPTIEAIFGFFLRAIDENSLVGKIGGPLFSERYWSFIDWTLQWNETMGVPSATKQGAITMESLLFATVLSYGAQLAEFIGRNELAKEYRVQSERVKEAIRTYCSGDKGLYQDGPGIEEYSQHCQVWAVLSETVIGEQAKLLIKRTLEDESLAKCSVAMAYYLFRAVEKVGLYEETEHLWEPWREMIRQNLTTCVEDPVAARSDCHAWGSLILYELPSVVLGVRPVKPGFEEVEIKPLTGYLEWAKGKVITPKGLVSVSWEKVGEEIRLEFKVPQGMTIVNQ